MYSLHKKRRDNPAIRFAHPVLFRLLAAEAPPPPPFKGKASEMGKYQFLIKKIDAHLKLRFLYKSIFVRIYILVFILLRFFKLYCNSSLEKSYVVNIKKKHSIQSQIRITLGCCK